MADKNIEPLQRETYLKMIENSSGTKLFNSIIVKFKDSGKIADVCQDGVYSCAFFVSGVLYLLRYLDKTLATVKSLRENFTKNGWLKVPGTPQAGDVIFWETVTFEDGSQNEHVGFALSATEAVSTSYIEKIVVKHHITFGEKSNGTPNRAITEVFRHE